MEARWGQRDRRLKDSQHAEQRAQREGQVSKTRRGGWAEDPADEWERRKERL